MKKEFKIGIAAIVALIILFIGINYLKGINMFKSESYYHVDYTEVNGLALSSPVYANGFKVGLVRDIQYNFNKPGHITVGIDMDDNIKIPVGSKAELVTEMLGTVKMNLIMNYGENQTIAPGDTIEGYANNGIMAKAEKDLLPQMEKMMPKLDSILSSLNKILADPAIGNTLKNAEQITASLNQTSNHLQRLMSNDIPKLTGNVTAITEDLKVISGNLKGIDYAATFNKIDETLKNVYALTDKLNKKDNTIGLLLNDPELYNNLNATSENAASLLKDLQENPKRYVHFSLFGRKSK
ncbi:MCE family protein [Bacteroides caecigallinarum]|uniref:MlaD family protein n=1 Tax=Bacteroides caecigallinarum TaxID=1411144 RepID=UPI0019565D2A|nr:MlaD family protein [Bacteroides caecigallinarum]MBM6863632.1 MCE family protein [Bacteroides caecigallinarum]MBU3807028.1 MCE family protein [Candidatus Phocaeicola faecipullorum]